MTFVNNVCETASKHYNIDHYSQHWSEYITIRHLTSLKVKYNEKKTVPQCWKLKKSWQNCNTVKSGRSRPWAIVNMVFVYLWRQRTTSVICQPIMYQNGSNNIPIFFFINDVGRCCGQEILPSKIPLRLTDDYLTQSTLNVVSTSSTWDCTMMLSGYTSSSLTT